MRYPTSEMTKRRGPFTDPREGRVLRQIANAYAAHDTDVLDASVLLEWAYCHRIIRKRCMRSRTGKPVKWPHEMLKRALLKVATPIGRSPKGSGRPTLWKLDPERAKERTQLGRINRKRKREGLPPIELG